MIRLVEILATGVTDDSGVVLASGQVYTYQAGTTTLTTTWQDFEQEDPHSNPITLDTAGRAIVYAEDRIKLVIKTSAGATVRTIDNVGTADADISGALASNLAGNGLIEAADGTIALNVDGTTTTITSDQVKVVSAGIVDDSTVEASGNLIRIKDSGVTTDKISNGSVTQAKRAALGQQLSSSSGTFSTSNSSDTDVTNLSVTITTTGRPVFVGLIADGSTSAQSLISSNSSAVCTIKIFRGATAIALYRLNNNTHIPSSALSHVDIVSAGTYVYKVTAAASTGSVGISQALLIAFEL